MDLQLIANRPKRQEFHALMLLITQIIYIKVDGLKQFNKEKKKIKKWARPYDTLVASEPLMKMIPRLLGNVLVKIGKFPITMSEGENVVAKVEEVKSTVRFQLKKVLYSNRKSY